MSLLSRERAGYLPSLANSAAHGGDWYDLQRIVGAPLTGETTAIYLNLSNAVTKARQAGAMATDPAYDGSVPVGAIPGYVTGRTAFKYSYFASFTNPAGGPDQVRTYSIISSYQLLEADLQADAERQASRIPPPASLVGRYHLPDEPQAVTRIEVYSLERWD